MWDGPGHSERSEMYKTTKKDFEEFKKECEYWIEYFYLRDWEVIYQHVKIDSRAEIRYSMASRITNLKLAIEWSDAPYKNEIKKVAFHEVCELLLAPLTDIVQNSAAMDINDRMVHMVIRRLENTIFKEKRK